MSGWDDLFASAAGIDNTGTQRSRNDDDGAGGEVAVAVALEESTMDGGNNQTSDEEKQAKRKRKKRKRDVQKDQSPSSKGGSSRNDRNKEENIGLGASTGHRRNRNILESRLDPVSEQVWSQLPNWLTFGACFGDNGSEAASHNTISGNNGIKKGRCKAWSPMSAGKMECRNCHLSPLHHALKVRETSTCNEGNQGDEHRLIDVFCLIRDVRSSCSCMLERGQKINMKEYAHTSVQSAKQLMGSHFYSLSPGEAEILYGKFEKVLEGAKRLKDILMKWSKPKTESKSFHLHGVFDDIVGLIIHCDDAYYRLYYLQISGHLGASANLRKFIPHPPTYFGTRNMAWNVSRGRGRAMKFKKWVMRKINCEDDDIKKVLESSGLNVLPSDGAEGSFVDTMDPLSFLHQNRVFETITVFWKSGWLTSQNAADQTITALERPISKCSDAEENFYNNHHTPAPRILSEWRDCCRDLLCNLYAYATLSPGTVQLVKDELAKQNIVKVIEMGAGTGYVASLLSKAGIQVSAYDVTPTQVESINEYHGSTPSYCAVKSGTSKNFPSILPSRNDTKKTALLLCYPPPMSSMAEDTVRNFLSQGGRTIIHVGEFRGLTGSAAFEKTLQRRFDLSSNFRSRCMRWGTDAAAVTIWSKVSSKQKVAKRSVSSSSLLLPCSNCHKEESSKRCRLMRSLTYCCSKCFKEHNETRKVLLDISMIPSDVALSYSNNLHFANLE